MSIAQTVAKTYFNTSSPFTLVFGAPATAGRVILVAINMYDGGAGHDASCADDKSGGSNSYTAYGSPDLAARTKFFVAENIGAAQTITITPTATINGFAQAWEISETPASSVVEGTPVFYSDADSSPDASVTMGSSATVGNLVFVACGTRENFGTFALANPTTGYTSDHLDTTQSGAQIASSMAHKTVTVADAQTAAWSHDSGSPGSAGIIVIKQQAAAGVAKRGGIIATVYKYI